DRQGLQGRERLQPDQYLCGDRADLVGPGRGRHLAVGRRLAFRQPIRAGPCPRRALSLLWAAGAGRRHPGGDGKSCDLLPYWGPQEIEVSGMAFRNDPDVPDYSIRVMRDGTEAEIVGGFKFGLTEDFVKILSASRQISVVHLDSIGGRLGEGEKMFKLIRDRG